MRVKKRSVSIVAAATLLLAMFGGAASAATPTPTPADYVKQAIAKQLAHKPGGVVENGDTIVYPDVAITYSPKTASGTAMTAMSAALWGCYNGYVCLYANGDHTDMRLNTSSLWCPNENTTRGAIILSDYGLSGNLRSADSENNYWVRAYYFVNGWSGIQWTMTPLHAIYNGVAQNTDEVWICINQGDLWNG
jgi:hypothetical protein